MIVYEGISYPEIRLYCNREHMLQLVEALESGEYRQGLRALRLINPVTGAVTYCCAGVACEISQVGSWNAVGGYRAGDMFSSQILPHAVVSWLGLDDPRNLQHGWDFREAWGTIPLTGILPSNVHEPRGVRLIGATALNDNGRSFGEIAAQLREVYLWDESEGADV